MGDNEATALASGSLSMLDLGNNAVGTYDTGRMQWLLAEHSSVLALKSGIGSIPINYDQGITAGSLVRLNKDAEVHALCLLVYWLQSPGILVCARDLTFELMHGGLGSHARTATLQLINADEAKRKVMLTS